MRKRLLSTLLALCMVLAFPAFAKAYSTGDDYPAEYKNAGADTLVDRWNFYNRECTSFVAWCLNSRNEISFTNQYMGVSRWGNAGDWAEVARGLGMTVDMNPAVGAVAWWGVSATSSTGHVAWVSAVNGDTVTIEEYNGYPNAYAYQTRNISRNDANGYIHIADISACMVETVDNLTWSFDERTGTLTISGTGAMTDSHPSFWPDIIGPFKGIKTVVIGDSITSIGNGAFKGCQYMTSVSIPNSVTSIGNGAFEFCHGLTNVSIPNSVTSIGDEAFKDCFGLTSVSIPDSVTSIGDHAFSGCTSLTNIAIPRSVTSIGSWVFPACTSLTSLPDLGSLTTIGYGMFSQCSGLTDITIPNNITTIGGFAFGRCDGLTSVTIPSSVTIIDQGAFQGCDNLTDVSIPSSVASISIYSFMSCPRLTAITVDPQNPSYMSADGILFTKDKTQLICYPGGKNASHYTIPSGVTTIDGAFTDCGALISVTIPNSVTSIGIHTFSHCTRLKSVTIPNSVTCIDGWAFNGCTGLASITIPKSVTKIDYWAFENCTSLADVYYEGSESDWKRIEINNDDDHGNDPLLSARLHYNSTGMGSAGEDPGPAPDRPTSDDDTSVKKQQINFGSHADSSGGTAYVALDINWGWDLFDKSAKGNPLVFEERFPSLAIAGLALSAASERSQSSAEGVLRQLGFENPHSDNYGMSLSDIYHPGVTFGHRYITTHGEGRHIFAVVVRGTTDPEDFISDVYGFGASADNLYGQFQKYVEGTCGLNFNAIRNQSKVFVTGHSLGGATANVLAKKLNHTFGSDNIFAYTFASPLPGASPADAAVDSQNIFNMLNIEDGVTKVPPRLKNTRRYGWDMWFHRNIFASYGFYDNFRVLTGRNFNEDTDSAHDPAVYMSYVLTWDVSRQVKIVTTVLHVFCPVDVEIYASNGQLVGSVTDNAVSNMVSDKTYIYVDGDEKYIYLLDEDDYSVKLTGTGEGVLTYSVQNMQLGTGEVVAEKTFSNVRLVPGKEMTSTVHVKDQTETGTDVSLVPLYVLGSTGEAEKEVLPDGNGTEVPLGTANPPAAPDVVHTVSFDTTTGSVVVPAMVTGADGRLASLPAPVWSGHRFEGWYLADGTRVTTSTVFTGDTTVSARWTRTVSMPETNFVSLPPAEHGKIITADRFAAEGDRVNLSVHPDDGYTLASLTVTAIGGKEITLRERSEGKYSFTMPDRQVKVIAEFEKIQ